MTIHTLKVAPGFWWALADETKTFEVRKNDRDYHAGDVLVLWQWLGNKAIEGPIFRRVTYVLYGPQYGVEEGYVVMAVTPLKHNEIRELRDPKPPE